ncbi:2-dehydro-3-deoxygalactonokinase [Aliishimia ponticola]|uniref:2-dehydro-3-deoxygalactonokinase n=1 Tax=Aliishimia ponticola TaxID=2499833 RepID=A0A4S4N9T0_9RHOB|nr:2-dehydro-3-deoxygalactonokinase [Aliishimia ponticola]THH35949.1 2-dehydro-3-deoxygalactonokinase [Aliishimia ponticola]
MSKEWIAVDWGTTHLRVWRMAGREIMAKAASDKGMNTLAADGFEPALLELVEPWLTETPTRVLCCGMVGSRQGWIEAPYRPVPCAPLAETLVRAPTRDPRLDVRIVPGLSQSSPPDVMRGEETQIAGFLALKDGWDGVICLPGTHTKWVHLSAGEVVSFQTFMTGELFALLAGQSVLRHSVDTSGWDAAAFAEAASEAMSRPEALAARLFRLRAAHLLEGPQPARACAELSGLLIGAELAAARPYWLGQNIAVIGADAVARAYVEALSLQGNSATFAKSDAMTQAGLVKASRDTE